MSQETPSIEPTEPDGFEERLVAYLDGELDPQAAQEVEALIATDATARRTLERLDRTWRLLDGLDRHEVDEQFTQSTLEMVAVAAEQDVQRQREEVPRRRRRRRLLGLLGALAAGFLAFLAVAAFRPDPNRRLLEDLPAIEDLDEYRQIDDVEFLRELRDKGLFVRGADDES